MSETMRKVTVAVGSKNPAKLKAVENAFLHFFSAVELKSFDVSSGVHHQPKTREETTRGAVNRAKAAWEKCEASGIKPNFGVGIESGLFAIPDYEKHLTGGVAAIFDGKHCHVGFSPAFELPPRVVKKVFDTDSEVGAVFDEILQRKNVKHSEGAVGVLSKGKFTRDKMLELGVAMALCPIVSAELY